MADPRSVFKGFDPTIAAINSPKPFLGNESVIETLVREFIHTLTEAKTVTNATAAVDRMATIFCGLDDGYEPSPGWNTRGDLGMAISTSAGVDPDQSLHDILRTFFMDVATRACEIIKQASTAPDDEWQFALDALIEWASAILLGTAELTHPLDDDGDDQTPRATAPAY